LISGPRVLNRVSVKMSQARAEKTVDEMIGCGVNVIRDGKWVQIGWFHFVTAPRLGDHILIQGDDYARYEVVRVEHVATPIMDEWPKTALPLIHLNVRFAHVPRGA
jgi:hypothetical protein